MDWFTIAYYHTSLLFCGAGHYLSLGINQPVEKRSPCHKLRPRWCKSSHGHFGVCNERYAGAEENTLKTASYNSVVPTRLK